MPTLSAGYSLVPSAYTYGNGRGARSYRAYSYGSGYRNRSYGRGYGYGRSQGLNRGVIAGLVSARSTLTRVAHNYQGHRVRAMNAISMAIRQLSHQSMRYNGMGLSSGVNNGGVVGMRQGAGAERPACDRARSRSASTPRDDPGPIRQPDGPSSATLAGGQHAARSQGSYSNGHSRARGHVQQAMHELNVALSIR